MTSASLLIVLLVGTVVGALVGLALGGSIDRLVSRAARGLSRLHIGVIVRNFVLARGGLGPDDPRTPVLVIIYAAVASLGAGSSALRGGASIAACPRRSGSAR